MPRHTVYYIIPKEGVDYDGLLEWLNSPQAKAWLQANCQRAANGFLRLQSKVLKALPVPAEQVGVDGEQVMNEAPQHKKTLQDYA